MKLSFAYISAFFVTILVNAANAVPTAGPAVATTAATVATKAATRLFGAQRELRGDCENLDSFRYDGDETLTCDTFVAEKPRKRCKKKQPRTGIKLKVFCPATCKKKCKTDSPTFSPTVKRKACENSDSFRFEGDATQTCDSYVAEKPRKRCNKKQPGTDKKLKFFCPSTCKGKCRKTNSPTSSPTVKRGPCENSDSFRFEGDATQTCDSYVAEKARKRCKKFQSGTDIKLKFFCPATCKRKCKKTDPPTAAPTASLDPSSAPSLEPSTSPSVSSYPSLAQSDSPSESSYPSSLSAPDKS